MDRIKLTRDQKTVLHAERITVEKTIKDLKKLTRGQPHTGSTYADQSNLVVARRQANAIYTLLAASRGVEHNKKAPEILEALRKRATSWVQSNTKAPENEYTRVALMTLPPPAPEESSEARLQRLRDEDLASADWATQ